MPKSHDPRSLEFGGPARYRIVVQGVLSDASRRRLSGVLIERAEEDGVTPRTVLLADVRDQTELRGVLDALYGLHLSVISVDRCNGD